MNKSDLLDKIKSLLNRMRDHETPDNITSREELGPLLKDAEELLETVSVLKYLIEEEEPATTEQIPEPEEVVIPDPIPEPVEPVLRPDQLTTPETSVEDLPTSEEEKFEETQPEEEAEALETEHALPPSDNPFQSLPTDDETTVNDAGINSQEQIRVADKLESEAVVDLHSSIGLNERFLYISELFDGNDQAYQIAIDQLNTFTNVQDAIHYIRSEISDKFNWDQEQESTISFYALIEKRYAN